MPVQSATSTRGLIKEKPAAPLRPLDLPPSESSAPAVKPEETPPTLMSGPKLPTVFPVYAWI
jgi:hypothetical protein